MQRQRSIDRHIHVYVCVWDYKFFMNLQRLPWASPYFWLIYICCKICLLPLGETNLLYMDGMGCTAASWRFLPTGAHEERWCGGASLQGIERAWFLKLFWPTKAGRRFVVGWWSIPETKISYPLQRKNLKNIFLFQRWDMYPFPGGAQVVTTWPREAFEMLACEAEVAKLSHSRSHPNMVVKYPWNKITPGRWHIIFVVFTIFHPDLFDLTKLITIPFLHVQQSMFWIQN